MAKIVVSLPDGSEVTHELHDPQITIGRISENAIQIEDPSVSSFHGEFRLVDDHYELVDLGSTNGTLINEKPATPEEKYPLRDGDHLRFGKVAVRFLSEHPGEAQPLPDLQKSPVVVTGETSVRPADFSNASPFQTKRKKKDTTGLAIIAGAVVALLAFGGGLFMVLSLTAPQ